MKKILKKILLVIGVVVLIAGLYVAYVFLSYDRLEDNLALEPDNPGTAAEEVEIGKELKLASWNIGFAAYLQDYTFFMDGGVESRARSEEAVLDSMDNMTEKMKEMDADFYFVQEVDFDSTRAYHVDERQIIRDKFKEMSYVWAQNYDSAYLMYPFKSPHGANKSSLVTLSSVKMTDSLRRSLPIQSGFVKIFDLDRCYDITRVPTDNGKDLVLINFHLSAYTTDPAVGNNQLKMLYSDIEKEYKKGNYVICGGDFNKDIIGNSSETFGIKKVMSWCMPYPEDDMPDFVSLIKPIDWSAPYPTCRDDDIPYQEGKSFVCSVDGFIATDNIEIVKTDVEHEDFKYSDHNPVYVKFILK